MRISLITPSFNHDEFIRRTIDSVLGQAGDFELEYVVLDGGSTDRTKDILQSYGDRLRWTSEPDGGQVDAINSGLKKATGDVVGWLNSDDVLLPNSVQRVANCFRNNPACEWVHGGCQIIDRDDREIRSWVSRYKRRHAMQYSRASLLSRNFVSQMTVFWRRHAMDAVGYLDPELPLAFDYDYWLRLSKLGDPIYIDEPQAAFRWYETSKSGANFKQQCLEDEAISKRHGNRSFGRILSKRMQNAARIAMYNAMSLTDRLRSTR